MLGFGAIAAAPIAGTPFEVGPISVSLTETAVAADAVTSEIQSIAASLTETAVAADLLSAVLYVANLLLNETATATDAIEGVLESVSSSLTEAAAATETIEPQLQFLRSLTETASPTDTVDSTLYTGLLEINETANATDLFETVLYARWNYLPTVISQYFNSPILRALLDYFSQSVDQDYDVTQFFLRMWNINSAEGYGLDVWGRIVGVERTIQVSTGTYFEFQQQDQSSSLPFGGGPFFSGDTSTENFVMSDEVFRRLILAKALSNICGGSIPAINQILMFLFPDMGNCYVTDGEDMTMEFVFGAALSPAQYAIISQTGVLPRPVGVAATIVEP